MKTKLSATAHIVENSESTAFVYMITCGCSLNNSSIGMKKNAGEKPNRIDEKAIINPASEKKIPEPTVKM